MVYARCWIRRLEEVNELRTKDAYIDTHLRESLVEENSFVRMPPEDIPPPSFEDAWDSLPQPFWGGHEGAIDCYRRAWELAFSNLRRPEPESGFVASYIDTAFNDCLFMWDSAFILLFGRTAAVPSPSTAPWITSTP